MRRLLGVLLTALFVLVPIAGEAARDRPTTDFSTKPSFKDPFADDHEAVRLSDPFEPINRGIFYVNDRLYVHMLRPTAKGWKVLVPHYGRTRISNVFDNLDDPASIVNSILQAEPKKAGLTTARFITNSTVGVAGLFDPTSYWVETDDETFDRTFRKWGIYPGPYVMLPLLGPTTVRGTVGLVFDNALYPLNYADGEDAAPSVTGASALRNINYTSLNLGTYETLKANSIDDYQAVKNAYEQRLEEGRRLLEE